MTFATCKQCGSRNLAREEDGVVCRNCGVVDIQASIGSQIAASEIIAKASTSSDHHPMDYLKIVEMGSQHDMSSVNTIGTAMELCNPRAKDAEGRKISEGLLTFPYVTGQAVGKNAQVVEIPGFNVWYGCGHSEQFEGSYDADRYCMNKECRTYPVFGFALSEPIIKRQIKEVYQYLIPKAKRNFRDDTIYRKAKVGANKWASKLQMDDVTRRYYGLELNKVYDEFVGTTDILPLVALLRLKMNYQGLDVKMSAEIDALYGKLLEKMRLFLTEPAKKVQLVAP